MGVNRGCGKVVVGVHTVAHDHRGLLLDGLLGDVESQVVGEQDAARDGARGGVDVFLEQAHVVPGAVGQLLGVQHLHGLDDLAGEERALEGGLHGAAVGACEVCETGICRSENSGSQNAGRGKSHLSACWPGKGGRGCVDLLMELTLDGADNPELPQRHLTLEQAPPAAPAAKIWRGPQSDLVDLLTHRSITLLP